MNLSDTATMNVESQQFDRLLRQGRLEAAVAALCIALGVLGANGLVPVTSLAIWVALGLLFVSGRLAMAEGARRRQLAGAAIPARRRWFTLLVGGSALCWGALTAAVVAAHDPVTAWPLLVLAAVSTLAVVGFYAGSFIAGTAAALGALVPPAVALVATSDRSAVLGGAALVVLAATAIIAARLLRRYGWEAALLQNENEQMHGHLDQRRTQIEKLNVALKTTQGKLEQAELSVRRTAADLGLAQGKAKALADTLERVSPLCQVTGLANRRHFDQLIHGEWRRAARDLKPISIVLVDVDEYEEYDATYGGQSADALLKRMAQALKGYGHRAGDTAGRYDGSKLALLLPGCNARNAGRLAEAMRKRIEGLAIPHANAKNREIVTVHVGVAMLKPTRALQPAELFKRVDAALYEARFQGGNKVVVYQPLSKLRIERWDQPTDGPLHEQSLLQKLLIWGYDTTKQVMRPHATQEPQLLEEEQVVAILSGEVKIDVEGHTMTIKDGDCVFVPRGVEFGLEVVGDKPAVKLTAVRHK